MALAVAGFYFFIQFKEKNTASDAVFLKDF